MTWRAALVVVAALLFVVPAAAVVTAPPVRHTAASERLPLPTSMVALGDSITTGFNACGKFQDCPERSWSTGTDAGIDSQYERLRAISPAIDGHATNLAKSGVKVADLRRQADAATRLRPDYVTILIGANDVCTSSEDTMTSVADFRARLDEGLAALASLSRTRVVLVSIPDLLRLWEVEHRDRLAQLVWYAGGICQSMLGDARAVDDATMARRDRVRQRVIDFNEQLREACVAFGPHCRYDNAVFDHPFTASEVSSWDAFHPSDAGQRVIADVTSAAGFDW